MDVIISPTTHPPEHILIDDVGLSVHMLVSWSENLAPPLPTYSTILSRNWRQFDIDTFVHHLEQSELCRPCEGVYDLDFMTDRFDIVITGLLDPLAPVKSIIIRERSRQPWYDSAFSSC